MSRSCTRIYIYIYICGLFNDAVSNSKYITLSDGVMSEQ